MLGPPTTYRQAIRTHGDVLLGMMCTLAVHWVMGSRCSLHGVVGIAGCGMAVMRVARRADSKMPVRFGLECGLVGVRPGRIGITDKASSSWVVGIAGCGGSVRGTLLGRSLGVPTMRFPFALGLGAGLEVGALY